MKIDTRHPSYESMASLWQRCRDCYDGSDAIKGARTRYLPALDGHTQENYDRYESYLDRAMFYNAMGKTVDGMAGAVFSKTPTVKMPKSLEPHLDDITLTGEPMELFGLEACKEILVAGRYGVLVDMALEQPEGEQVRPYWVGFRAEDVRSWYSVRYAGQEVLTRVVLREEHESLDPEDTYKVVSSERYRVCELLNGVYTQSIWHEGDRKGQWLLESTVEPQRRGQGLNFIPFTFITPNSTTCAVRKPPLNDLAILNISHYMTMADLEWGRHLVALPTPWLAGVQRKKDGEQKQMLGPGITILLDKDGRAGMLEFTGQGLRALETAEAEKRKMMATLGARLLEDQPVGGAETATAVQLRHAGSQANLKSIVQSLERGLSAAMRWHTWWLDTAAKPIDMDAAVELNKDFFSVRMTSQELQALVMALQADAISYETFWDLLTAGGIARPGITAEQEQKAIAEKIDENNQRQVDLAKQLEPPQPPEETGVPAAA